MIGQTIGRVRIEALLGQGGMGEVYRGFDEVLRRPVAVKTISAAHRLESESKARFRREAQLLSKLNHPGICQVYDLIEGEAADYLILEYVEGRRLKDVMEQEPSSFDRKLHLAEGIAAALAAAHDQKVVHRDLKPDNVMVTDRGEVKVLDFGIARSLGNEVRRSAGPQPPPEPPGGRAPDDDGGVTGPGEGRHGGDGEPPSATGGPGSADSFGSEEGFRTRHGFLTGTLAYMSPEQARGEPTTAASDLYSLGLLLQELFTGRRAYPKGLTRLELLARAQRAETQPVTGLDGGLTRLIADLKRLEPRARPPADEVRDRLSEIRSLPARRSQRTRQGLGLAALLLVVGAAWWWSRHAHEPLELRVQIAQPPAGLDPVRVQDVTSSGIAARIFSGLMRLDPDLLDPLPDLAESYTVSEDGRVYTFELLKGSVFHNGHPITAADVKASWEWAASPEVGGPYAELFDPIEGAAAFRASESPSISGIEVLGQRTLRVTLSTPAAPFLLHLTSLGARIVPVEEARELGDDFSRRPVGSGPYRVASWDEDLILEAFADHPRGAPPVERVVYSVEPALERALEGYRDGRFDLLTRLPPLSFSRLRAEYPDQMRVVSALVWSGICFSCREEPFSDPRVRRAFALALDREALVKRLEPSLRIASVGFVPPGILGHDPSTLRSGLDLDRAREELAAAGFPGGEGFPEVPLVVPEGELPGLIGDFVVASLEEIGVETRWVSLPMAEYYQGLEAGRFGFFATGVVANIPDPDDLLRDEFRTSGSLNFFGFSDPGFDELLDEGWLEREPGRRAEAYRRAQAVLVQEAPCSALYHASFGILVRPRWAGLRFAANPFPEVERTIVQAGPK